MRTPQAVMSTGTVVLFPLTLASNVFVWPATMPGWLQAFVRVNRPAPHSQNGGRGRRGELTAPGFTVVSGTAMSATARCRLAC